MNLVFVLIRQQFVKPQISTIHQGRPQLKNLDYDKK
jgi:hypothetical protein